jgi:hypothetical protein
MTGEIVRLPPQEILPPRPRRDRAVAQLREMQQRADALGTAGPASSVAAVARAVAVVAAAGVERGADYVVADITVEGDRVTARVHVDDRGRR